MTHVRQQIRDAVRARLLGLSASADRVFVGRTRPLAADHAPTILIYTVAETSARSVRGAPPILDRVLTVHVDARVQTAMPPDDELDAMATEIEAAMALDNTLGGLLLNLQMVGMDQAVEAPGERHNGGLRLEYRATYRTREGEPTAAV